MVTSAMDQSVLPAPSVAAVAVDPAAAMPVAAKVRSLWGDNNHVALTHGDRVSTAGTLVTLLSLVGMDEADLGVIGVGRIRSREGLGSGRRAVLAPFGAGPGAFGH